MKLIARLFWPLIPVTLLFVTYREANSDVVRLIALAPHSQEAWETYKDLGSVASKVAIYYKTAQKLPADLPSFLTQMQLIKTGNRGREAYEDVWLTPYQLRDLGDSYEVLSCGPDRDCETETDNLVERIKKVKGAPPAKGAAALDGDNALNLEIPNLDPVERQQ